jgi:chloramphenicol 3-O phosphotransferase
MKIALILATVAIGALAATYFFMTRKQAQYGTVIILNGPSTAGKSSIQREFQKITMPNLCIKVGIDNLFDLPMPDINPENMSFWQTPNPIRWVSNTTDNEQNTVITLFTGEQGDRVAYGMNTAIAGYAKAGCDVIVDYIAYKKEWIDDLQAKLKNTPTIWVKVAAPIDVLEAREVARGTSPKGHARSHHATVHWDLKYDLVVDSARESAAAIAQKIKDLFVS